MSPWAALEQQQTTRYERINASADLYMLAATMCFAATGAAPPRAEERLTSAAWDPALLLAEVPLGGGDSPALRDALIQAVVASLALAAPARPQRADDVRHILHPQGHGAFVATTGPAPLWVGEVPDRDSQWETLEGMSGPAPLRDNVDTQIVMEPIEPSPPAEPRIVRSPVRAEPTLDAADMAGRRAADVVARPPRQRLTMAAVAAGAAVIAALVWWSQKPPSNLALPASPPEATVVITPAAVPAVVQALPPAAASALAAAPIAVPIAATAAREELARGTVPAAAAKVETPERAAVATAAQPVPAATPAAPVTAPPAPVAKAAIAAAPKAAARAPAKAATKAVVPKAVAKRNEKPVVAASKAAPRPAATEGLCGNRTQFAYLYCMQEQCTRAAQRNNPQCAALRRSGELR